MFVDCASRAGVGGSQQPLSNTKGECGRACATKGSVSTLDFEFPAGLELTKSCWLFHFSNQG